MDRCPICQVAVKPENLARHLNEIHPRHPDTVAISERLMEEGRATPRRAAGAPIRIRTWHVAVPLVLVLVVIGGIVAAPYFDPYRNFNRDSCIPSEAVPIHFHPFVRIFALDHYHPIPSNIGIAPGCTRPLHTHSPYDPSTGWVQVHVESPVARDFTLGDFFAVWGEPFSPTQVSTFVDDGTNHVTMQVDGSSTTAYGSLVLRDGQRIDIRYGP